MNDFWEKAASTWPARLARALLEGAKAPGDALAGKFSPAPATPGVWTEEDEFRHNQAQDEMMKRAVDLASLVTGGTFAAPRGVWASGARRRPRPPTARLPMDEASIMARRQQGYSDEPFWRGESSGVLPNEYPTGAHFSRDKAYADGFATRGGQREAREFRLNLRNAFSDSMDLTAGQYGRLIEAAMSTDPQLAANLAQQVAPRQSIDWLLGYARANPDVVVARLGAAALVRYMIQNSKDPIGVFKRAGFDALDSGRDVLKLDGFGIRSKGAVFDPAHADKPNIFLGLGGAALLPTVPEQQLWAKRSPDGSL